MAIVEVKNLGKTYVSKHRTTHAIGDLTFDIEEGEFLCIVGPSGCGKTTLLKCMCGLVKPSAGGVFVRDRRVTSPPEDMAVVFQDYSRSLMPWSSVRNNVLLPLRYKNVSKQERERLTEEALEAMGLIRFMDHYPWQLSGGMQQRVAIARALAYQPRILLMDEPFASVDAQTRADLEDLIHSVHTDSGVTFVFVTHDVDESVYLGDRVLVLTTAPTTVRESLPVKLPEPRDQVATKEHPDFVHLRAHVFATIRAEVAKARAGGQIVEDGHAVEPHKDPLESLGV